MNLDDLSLDALAVLGALISARLAWQSPGELASAARLDRDLAEDALADLAIAGWIQPWETEDGLDVTLTPLAAEQLGVHLVEFGPEEIPRWARAGSPEPPCPKAKNCLARYSALALVADRQPGPLELLIASENRPEVASPPEELDEAPPETDPHEAAARDWRRYQESAKRAEAAKQRRRAKRARLHDRRRRSA